MTIILHQSQSTRWALIGWFLGRCFQTRFQVPEAKVMIDPIPTGPDGKPRLGRFGELLDEDGVQILGEIFVHINSDTDRMPDWSDISPTNAHSAFFKYLTYG